MTFKKASAAVIITNNNKIVLGRSIKRDSWECPGGKHEKDESNMDCAIRETYEETSIILNPNQIRPIGLVENYSHLCVVYHAPNNHDTPMVSEPNKHYEWGWFCLFDLPKPMYDVTLAALELWLERSVEIPRVRVVAG